MRDRAGGLSIRFEQVTGKSAVAVVEWFGAAAITQTSLTGNWTPPTGVSIVSGSECVSREFAGRRQYLVANKPGGCVVELKFESARIPLTIALNSENGAASAYLPPRTHAKEVVRNYTFIARPGCSGPDSLYVHTMGRSGGSAVGTYCSDETNGWYFRKEDTLMPVTTKNRKDSKLQAYSVSVDWSGRAKAIATLGCSNSARHHDFVCETKPSFVEYRIETEELP